MQFLIAALCLFFATPHAKKEASLPQVVVIQPTSIKTLELQFFGFYGEAKSDADGNLFFHAATGRYNDSTVIKVRPARSEPVIFSLPAEFARSTYFEDFAVTSSGDLYVLAGHNENGQQLVFEFDSEGKLRRLIELQVPTDVRLQRFAVFEASGTMFLSGYHGPNAAIRARGKPFWALLDESGVVVRELRDYGETPETKAMGDSVASAEMEEGWSTVGPEGNLYVLTPKSILIVGESGQIRRRINLQKPENTRATKLQVSGTGLAIWLEKTTGNDAIDLTLEVINANSGRVLGMYKPSKDLGNSAVDFTESGFVFLKPAGRKMQLVTATLP